MAIDPRRLYLGNIVCFKRGANIKGREDIGKTVRLDLETEVATLQEHLPRPTGRVYSVAGNWVDVMIDEDPHQAARRVVDEAYKRETVAHAATKAVDAKLETAVQANAHKEAEITKRDQKLKDQAQYVSFLKSTLEHVARKQGEKVVYDGDYLIRFVDFKTAPAVPESFVGWDLGMRPGELGTLLHLQLMQDWTTASKQTVISPTALELAEQRAAAAEKRAQKAEKREAELDARCARTIEQLARDNATLSKTVGEQAQTIDRLDAANSSLKNESIGLKRELLDLRQKFVLCPPAANTEEFYKSKIARLEKEVALRGEQLREKQERLDAQSRTIGAAQEMGEKIQRALVDSALVLIHN